MSNTEGESPARDLQNTYTEDIFYCWENLLALNIFENLIRIRILSVSIRRVMDLDPIIKQK